MGKVQEGNFLVPAQLCRELCDIGTEVAAIVLAK
jgi:hypothetical protein